MRIKENEGKNKMNKGRRGFILSNGSEIKIELNFHFTLFHFPSFNVSPSSYKHFISSSMDPFVFLSIHPYDTQTVINDFQSQTEKCFRKYWNRSNRVTVRGNEWKYKTWNSKDLYSPRLKKNIGKMEENQNSKSE